MRGLIHGPHRSYRIAATVAGADLPESRAVCAAVAAAAFAAVAAVVAGARSVFWVRLLLLGGARAAATRRSRSASAIAVSAASASYKT